MKKTRIYYYSASEIRYPSARTLPRPRGHVRARRRTSTAVDDVFLGLAERLGMTTTDIADLAAAIAAKLARRPARERGSEGGSVARELAAAIAGRALDALVAPATRSARRKGARS